MPEPLSADETRRMRIVSIGMLAGVLVFLGIASLVHQMIKPPAALLAPWIAWRVAKTALRPLKAEPERQQRAMPLHSQTAGD